MICAALSLIALSLPPAAASANSLDALIDQLRQEVDQQAAMDRMRRMWEIDRWFTFPKFEENASYIEQVLNEMGLDQVERLAAPADGVTQVGYWTMPLAWDVREARLEIVEPEVSPDQRVLADYAKIPTSLGMWSGPTPPEGVVAEVVEWTSSSPEDLDLEGKLVLTRRNSSELKAMLVERGALGAINGFTENGDLKDGRQWVNAWGDRGWAYTKTSTPLLSFSISPRQVELLQQLLGNRGKVRVRAKVDSRYYTGGYPYVTGVIPGSGDAGEEVLILGHTSEPGAHDNASGVSALIEAMAALHRLIEQGKLPRPKRTMRVLAMGEMYGSMHYLQTYPERAKRTVGAICLDTPAGGYDLAGAEYTFYLNPQSSRSYADSLVLDVAEKYFGSLSPPRPWHWKEYMAGTDNYLGEPAIGIPSAWPYAGSGVHTHHNSEDKPESVDRRSLRDLTIITAAYLYTLAAAGEQEALRLAEIAVTRGTERILSFSAPMLEAVSSAETRQELETLLHQSSQRIAYFVERESQAVTSVERLVDPAAREGLRAALAPLTGELKRFGDSQLQRIAGAAERRAKQLGLAGRLQARPPDDDQRMSEARGIVVKRKRPGIIPFDDLPPADRKGYPTTWWGPAVSALYWCDGKRDLAEVIRLAELELGPTTFDFVDYFRFLERRGYVEFVK